MDKLEFMRSSGFSLIELLLALGLGMAVTAAALPSAARMLDAYRLEAAARGVAGDLELARMLAVTRNSQVAVRFDRESNSYWLLEGEELLAAARPLPRGVRLAEVMRRDIRFHSRGNAAPAGSVLIANPAGKIRVTVSAAGRVRRREER